MKESSRSFHIHTDWRLRRRVVREPTQITEDFFNSHTGVAPAVLRVALDNAWAFIEDPRSGVKDIERLEDKCKAVTPDLDEFNSAEIDLEAAAAQEAIFMIRLLLQFCRDNQVPYALRIATFAMDTIDMYVQAIENVDPADPRVDEIVAEHPLMRREVCKQEEDASRLAGIKTQADLHQFRKYATHLDRSNVGVLWTG